MGYQTVSKSVSIRRELLGYAQAVAAKESAARGRRVSFSEVVAWGLRALKKLRHDVPGKATALELTAEAQRRRALSKREVIENVRTVAMELAEMPTDVQAPATPRGGSSGEARTSASTAREGAPGGGRRGVEGIGRRSGSA